MISGLRENMMSPSSEFFFDISLDEILKQYTCSLLFNGLLSLYIFP